MAEGYGYHFYSPRKVQ